LGNDQRLGADAGVRRTAGAALIEMRQVTLQRLGDVQRPGCLGLVRERRRLRLREGEHGRAVGVAVVVGDRTQARFGVSLVAEIPAHRPRAWAASETAVEQVQARLDQSLIRLALDLEAGARLAAVQLAVA